ncbi:MAG: hypothetical protein LC650_05780 [Actinobacteria bacterium]|nr:hypothetical protein [Actinomycetota bacterium]
MANETIPHDFAVYLIDETHAWYGVPHMGKVERICGAYLIDRANMVHCASITPSLEATWIEAVPIFHEYALDEIESEYDGYPPECRARVADKIIEWYVGNPDY